MEGQNRPKNIKLEQQCFSYIGQYYNKDNNMKSIKSIRKKSNGWVILDRWTTKLMEQNTGKRGGMRLG